MKLFDFCKRKETFSDEEIEKEYIKAQRKVQETERVNSSLVRSIKSYAEMTCIHTKEEDMLAKKAEFIRLYSFRARQWRYYHSLNYKKGKFSKAPLWCQKWQDYEEGAHLAAQKRWREMLVKTR